MKKITLDNAHEEWDKLSYKQQKKITDEIWCFLYEHKDCGDNLKDFSLLHLIALFEYHEDKFKQVSELMLTEVWAELDTIIEAMESINIKNLKESIEKVKTIIEECVPDEKGLDMALLGSFIDSRIKTWHVNRKSYRFEHGLFQQPDFVVICGIGINKKYVKFSFEANEKIVKVVRQFIGNKKKKTTIRVISVVAHSIIK